MFVKEMTIYQSGENLNLNYFNLNFPYVTTTLQFSNLSFRFVTVTHSVSKLNELIYILSIYLDILTCLPLSIYGKNLVRICRPQASNCTLTTCEVPEQDWSINT